MRKPITLELSREETILLAGILLYSEGDILSETYHKLIETLDPKDLTRVNQICREIAVKGNGYYIDEADLLYFLAALDSHWEGVR